VRLTGRQRYRQQPPHRVIELIGFTGILEHATGSLDEPHRILDGEHESQPHLCKLVGLWRHVRSGSRHATPIGRPASAARLSTSATVKGTGRPFAWSMAAT
jgi:hypothetical protein